MPRARALRLLPPILALAAAGCFDFDGLLGRRAPPYLAVSDPVVPDDASAGSDDGGGPDLAPVDGAVDLPPDVGAGWGDLGSDGGDRGDFGPADGAPDGPGDAAAADLAAPPDLRAPPQIQHLATLVAPSDVRIGDLTGDGKPDILVAFPGATMVATLVNRGDGSFTWSLPTLLTRPTEALAPLADLDGDGRLDLAGTSAAAGRVVVAFGRGDGTFERVRSIDVNGGPTAIEVAEMNGDRYRDLVVSCAGSGDVVVLTGAAKGQFGAGGRVAVGRKPLLAVGDLDGDGALDLAGNDGPGLGNAAFYAVGGRGDGTFRGNLQSWNGARAGGLALADLDADGSLDIVYGDSKGGVVGALRNRGNLAFAAPVTSASGGQAPSAVAVADLDLDGALDVVCADGKADVAAVLRGSNRLQLGPPSLFATGAGPVAVRLGDLDGDGRPDVVTADAAGPSVTVILRPM